MIEVAVVALALSGPAVGPGPPSPPACSGCGPAVPSGPTAGFSTVDYQQWFGGPAKMRVGEVVNFYLPYWGDDTNVQLCYQLGGSRVGCATSTWNWWHLVVRRSSSPQYLTLRYDGRVLARLVYRDVR